MSHSALKDRRILVVEDNTWIGSELVFALEEAGAQPVGPVASVQEAIGHIASMPDLGGAVLDVNLAGELVFPVAYDLARRSIPFVFLTGYDRSLVAVRFTKVPAFEKPVQPEEVLEALAGLMEEPAARRTA